MHWWHTSFLLLSLCRQSSVHPDAAQVHRKLTGVYDLQGRSATHIVDKMLRNAYNMAYIQIALPGACLIHAVRHPLDVALSCFAQPFEGRGLPWASHLDGAHFVTPSQHVKLAGFCLSYVQVLHNTAISGGQVVQRL